MPSSAVFLYLRVAVGLLFVVAAAAKAWDRRAFRQAVEGFDLVPRRLAPAVAAIVVGMELAGGALLVAGVQEWLGALLLAILLSAFNVALVVNLRRGRRSLDCHCFGRRTVRIGWGHVAQNTVLLAAALAIGIAAVRRDALLPADDPAGHWLAISAAAYTALCFLAAQEMANVRAGLIRMLSRIHTE